jgi:hypothetical protein
MRVLLWRKLLVVGAGMAILGGAAGTAAMAASGAFNADAPGQQSIEHVATVQITPNNPTSYDISWVDPQTQTYYLADRTNNGVDAINASTDSFEGIVGQGDFVGAGSGPSQCTPFGTAGPNGILTLDIAGQTQLWAGDGVDATSPVSTVKVFTLTSPSAGTLAATINTGGVTSGLSGECRADELSYDPVDHLVLIANDLDPVPYVSLISVNANPSEDTVVAQIPFPQAIDGIEQSVWDPANDLFYVNIPQVPQASGQWLGEVALVNPRSKSVEGSFPAPGCSPGGLALDVQTQQMLLGCSGDAISGDTVGGVTYHPNPAVTLVMDANDGRIVASFNQVGGSDEVWLDPSAGVYYLAASAMTSNGQSTGYPTPVIGVISAGHGRFGTGDGPQFIENFPTTFFGDHSLAANPVNGQLFVPIVTTFPRLSGYGVAVFSGASALRAQQ